VRLVQSLQVSGARSDNIRFKTESTERLIHRRAARQYLKNCVEQNLFANNKVLP
jgi:hypothetical protein